MQKRVLIIFTILSLLLLTSCATIQGLFGPTKSTTAGKGIKLQFLNLPSQNLQEGDQFSFDIQVANYNKESINGELCVYDTPSESFGGIPDGGSCKDVQIEGMLEAEKGEQIVDTQRYSFPESGTFEYRNLDKAITQTSVLTSSLRYEVNQESVAQICIKNPNLNSNLENIPKTCDEKTTLPIEQSEFPLRVSITKEVHKISPTQLKINLQVNIQQVDSGDIIPKSKVFEKTAVSKPIVKFTLKSDILGIPYTCNPQNGGEVELLKSDTPLSKNERIIKCTAPFTTTQSYIQDTLRINLEYGFKKTEQIMTLYLTKQ